MPTFEYYCEACKHTTELFTTIKNKPDTISCEKCSQTARAILAAVQFKVKGANYKNGYAGESNWSYIKGKIKDRSEQDKRQRHRLAGEGTKSGVW